MYLFSLIIFNAYFNLNFKVVHKWLCTYTLTFSFLAVVLLIVFTCGSCKRVWFSKPQGLSESVWLTPFRYLQRLSLTWIKESSKGCVLTVLHADNMIKVVPTSRFNKHIWLFNVPLHTQVNKYSPWGGGEQNSLQLEQNMEPVLCITWLTSNKINHLNSPEMV